MRSRRAVVRIRRHASVRPGQRGMIQLLLRAAAFLIDDSVMNQER
jgi:hypothetical protein